VDVSDDDLEADLEADSPVEVAGHIAECAGSLFRLPGRRVPACRGRHRELGLEHYAEAASAFFGSNPFFGRARSAAMWPKAFSSSPATMICVAKSKDCCHRSRRTLSTFLNGRQRRPARFVTLRPWRCCAAPPELRLLVPPCNPPDRPGGQSYQPGSCRPSCSASTRPTLSICASSPPRSRSGADLTLLGVRLDARRRTRGNLCHSRFRASR